MKEKSIKDAIGKATDYTFDFDYVDLLYKALSRVDKPFKDITEEDIWDMIDDLFIYYNDIWVIAQHFHNLPYNISEEDLALAVNTDLSIAVEELSK